jgi:hypothetical protein
MLPATNGPMTKNLRFFLNHITVKISSQSCEKILGVPWSFQLTANGPPSPNQPDNVYGPDNTLLGNATAQKEPYNIFEGPKGQLRKEFTRFAVKTGRGWKFLDYDVSQKLQEYPESKVVVAGGYKYTLGANGCHQRQHQKSGDVERLIWFRRLWFSSKTMAPLDKFSCCDAEYDSTWLGKTDPNLRLLLPKGMHKATPSASWIQKTFIESRTTNVTVCRDTRLTEFLSKFRGLGIDHVDRYASFRVIDVLTGSKAVCGPFPVSSFLGSPIADLIEDPQLCLDAGANTVILFHGTGGLTKKPKNYEGLWIPEPCHEAILRDGFRVSEKAAYGPAVYLTDNIHKATNYGQIVETVDVGTNFPKHRRWIIVAEVQLGNVLVTRHRMKSGLKTDEVDTIAAPRATRLKSKNDLAHKLGAPLGVGSPIFTEFAVRDPRRVRPLYAFLVECTYAKH